MEDINRKPNWFVRTLIIAFCILLVSMILFSFFCVEPRGEIQSGTITLLLILLILILSETFDQFSIGKLFSVSREVKKKEAKVKELEKEKNDLFNQLINISTSQQQSQQHITVSGDYNAPMSNMNENTTDNSTAMGFTPSLPMVTKKGDKND